MKAIKFWAETDEDTENFFNYLRAHNVKDTLSWVSDDLRKGNIAWFVESNFGRVTYGRQEKYFNEHHAEEFFFPIPGPLLSDEDEPTNAPVVSDGLSTSYYQLTITNEAGDTIKCEMGDVIRCVVGDNFSLGNVLKAARRMYEASQGRGKKDVSMSYDANKIAYFSKEFAKFYEEKNLEK